MSYKGERRICKQINNDSKYMYAERKKKRLKTQMPKCEWGLWAGGSVVCAHIFKRYYST